MKFLVILGIFFCIVNVKAKTGMYLPIAQVIKEGETGKTIEVAAYPGNWGISMTVEGRTYEYAGWEGTESYSDFSSYKSGDYYIGDAYDIWIASEEDDPDEPEETIYKDFDQSNLIVVGIESIECDWIYAKTADVEDTDFTIVTNPKHYEDMAVIVYTPDEAETSGEHTATATIGTSTATCNYDVFHVEFKKDSDEIKGWSKIKDNGYDCGKQLTNDTYKK